MLRRLIARVLGGDNENLKRLVQQAQQDGFTNDQIERMLDNASTDQYGRQHDPATGEDEPPQNRRHQGG